MPLDGSDYWPHLGYQALLIIPQSFDAHRSHGCLKGMYIAVAQHLLARQLKIEPAYLYVSTSRGVTTGQLDMFAKKIGVLGHRFLPSPTDPFDAAECSMTVRRSWNGLQIPDLEVYFPHIAQRLHKERRLFNAIIPWNHEKKDLKTIILCRAKPQRRRDYLVLKRPSYGFDLPIDLA